MAKRPEFDLASLTADAAEPMQEAAQRAAKPAPSALPPTSGTAKPEAATGNVAPERTLAKRSALAFKVPPVFRRRFKQRAHDADLKLNELLFEALDAWEEKHGIKR